jgi:hypothetical protein
METNRIRKTIAILLAVLFLVSLTASAVSARSTTCSKSDNGIHQIGSSSSGSLFDNLIKLIEYFLNLIIGNSDNGVINIKSHPVLK